MGAVLAAIAIALLLAAAGLRKRGRLRLSGWLMVAFPAFLCLAYARDLALGPAHLGLAAYQSDQKQLGVALAMVAVTVLAALRPEWRWLFWIEWCLNAIVCGMLIYLVFFWKVFG